MQTPYYIIYEERLRRNLQLIADIARRADVKIIMALKANAMWKTFPIIGEYVQAATASSLNEMQLALDYLGPEVHSYCPVYTPETFPRFLAGSSHITFNTLAQFHRYYPQIQEWNQAHPDSPVSAGLRVNPHCPVVETDIYNPCLPGSRFGENVAGIGDKLPEGLEGLHFHALCESDSADLEQVFEAFEAEYGHLLPDLKWLNMGGGHLVTREGYDIERLVAFLKRLHDRYPGLQIIMEPGSAFTWQTGDLEVTVLDIVEDAGVKTAIIDASFACHMPDTLEMPYKPRIAQALPDDSTEGYAYRLGGNSCLAGDWIGDWRFAEPLKVGQRLTLCDMNHYTNVKTHMFNGIQHPDVWLTPMTGEPQLLRHYSYEDYRDRMD